MKRIVKSLSLLFLLWLAACGGNEPAPFAPMESQQPATETQVVITAKPQLIEFYAEW